VIRISRSELVVGQRQRREIELGKLASLRESILARGLLHPPIAAWDGAAKTYRLIAGERRLRALDHIAEQQQFFLCDGETFLPGEIPITRLTDLSPADLFDAELEENILREDLDWQDRIRAIAASHSMRKAENPEQTLTATAKELVEKGATQSVAGLAQRIREAEIVAPHLGNPSIAKARNASEAFQLVIQAEEAAFAAELIKRTTAKAESQHQLIEVRHGDSTKILPGLDGEQFDLILCDPPYGLSAGSGGFRSRTVHHHNYEDSPEAARLLLGCIISEGFRVCKNRANLFIFTDIDHFDWLRTISAQAGWTPFRTPVIWAKSDSEGLAPWGRQGFRRTYELIFFATKNKRGLITSPVDILRHNRVSRADRDYGPEKPMGLLKELIEAATLPNDFILDPCCGSGSSLDAARESRRRALGIEIDEATFNLSLVRAKSGKLKTSEPSEAEL
jgi:DNA modification methylase/ParB-like chromosome segregation protein Spo0J